MRVRPCRRIQRRRRDEKTIVSTDALNLSKLTAQGELLDVCARGGLLLMG